MAEESELFYIIYTALTVASLKKQKMKQVTTKNIPERLRSSACGDYRKGARQNEYNS